MFLLDNEEADDNNDQEKPNEEQEGIDSEDDDESDDDVKITIGDITAGPASYTAFNVKRGPGSAPQGMGEKSKVKCWHYFVHRLIRLLLMFIL